MTNNEIIYTAAIDAGIYTEEQAAAITASAAVTPTTAESATAFRAGFWLRLVHANGTAIERLPVERVNRRLGLFAVRHLDEAETL